MANLIIRDIDDAIMNALQQRASRNGVSIEVEHQKILRQVLLQPTKKSFAEVLALMPNVGQDTDFDCRYDDPADDVFA